MDNYELLKRALKRADDAVKEAVEIALAIESAAKPDSSDDFKESNWNDSGCTDWQSSSADC